MHGRGKFVTTDRVYIGEFVNGLYHGSGIEVNTRTNENYTGSFKYGLKDGQGVWHDGTGYFYNGSFKEGKLDGIGKAISQRLLPHMVFKQGYRHGHGVPVGRSSSSNEIIIQIGNFKWQNLHGRGIGFY